MLPCILRTQSRAISVARPVLIKNGLTKDCSKTLNQPLFKESSKAVTTRTFSTTSSIASKEKGMKCISQSMWPAALIRTPQFGGWKAQCALFQAMNQASCQTTTHFLQHPGGLPGSCL